MRYRVIFRLLFFFLLISASQASDTLPSPLPTESSEQVPLLSGHGILVPPNSITDLKVDSRVFDFGMIFGSNPQTHEFMLTNQGDTPVIISDIKSECGCTVSLPDGKKIRPGKSKPVSVTVIPERKDGVFTKVVTLTISRNGKQAELELTLKAEVRNVLHISPEHVYFKKLFFGKGGTAVVSIQSSGEYPTRVLRAEVVEGKLDLTLNEKAKEGKEGSETDGFWELTLKLPPETPAGRFHAIVKLITDSKLQPEVSFPVFGIVRSRVSINPTQCYFGTLIPGEKKQQRIVVLETGDFELAPPTITATIPELTWTVDTKQENKKYVINLELVVPQDHAGRLSGELVIHTNDETQPEFTIPIFGYTPHNLPEQNSSADRDEKNTVKD